MRRRISTRVVIGGSTLRSYGTVGGVEQEILRPLDVSREHGALLSSPVTERRFDTRGFAAGLSGTIEIQMRNGSSIATCVSRYGNARVGGCTT